MIIDTTASSVPQQQAITLIKSVYVDNHSCTIAMNSHVVDDLNFDEIEGVLTGEVGQVDQDILVRAPSPSPVVVTADPELNHVQDQGIKEVQEGNDDHLVRPTSTVKRFDTKVEVEPSDAEQEARQELIKQSTPTTPLEIALTTELERKAAQISRLSSEVIKLKQFISKRKQTYKRKRKEDGAPTRALSAYNIFVQDRFEQLAKENQEALMSTNSDAKMKRVPPSSLVARTGNEWRDLDPEKKLQYYERAKTDKKRYEEEMARYQPPEKQLNKKRNKTGYNMFFSAHVQELKASDTGVPSERGSVARLVGNAWKELTSEQKQYYEQEADRVNESVYSDTEEDDLKENEKRGNEAYPPSPEGHIPVDVHHGIPPQLGHAPVVHQPHHGDPRGMPYPPPPGYPPHPYPYEFYPPPMHPPPPSTRGSRGSGGHHPAMHPHPYYPPPYPPPPYHEPPHHE